MTPGQTPDDQQTKTRTCDMMRPHHTLNLGLVRERRKVTWGVNKAGPTTTKESRALKDQGDTAESTEMTIFCLLSLTLPFPYTLTVKTNKVAIIKPVFGPICTLTWAEDFNIKSQQHL